MTPLQLESLADALQTALAVYGSGCLAFASAFAWKGAAQLDPAAQDMPLPARLLLIPAASALWPLLLLKWWRRRPAREGLP